MKRYQEIWSEVVFTIDPISCGNPTTYEIKDQYDEPIKGTFYKQELQLIVEPKTYRIVKVIQKKN